MEIKVVDGVRFTLGEGPLWDPEAGRLYAVDIMAKQIVEYDPVLNQALRHDVGEIIGSLALRRGGGAIVGLANGVHLFDFKTGKATLLADVEPDDKSLFLTEGKADASGRFLVSTFSTNMTDPVGSLYSIALDGAITKLRGDIVVPNGLAWSPDQRTLYFADSGKHTIYAYDYDDVRGLIGNERIFANTEALGGVPDGATVDVDGNYWVALCQGGVVVCYAPDGTLKQQYEFPTKFVTSVTFGGAGLDKLFVTSLDPSVMNLGSDPEGGKLFVLSGTGARGMADHRYAG